MINKYITLPTDDGENMSTTLDSENVQVHSLGLLSNFDTQKKSMSIGKAAAWDIDWSGITSGSGLLTLQVSGNGGTKWNTAVKEDGTTAVAVTVTGVPTETTLVVANKCNALHYRWKYEDTDTAGADAIVKIYMQVEE